MREWAAYLWYWGDCQRARLEGEAYARGVPDGGGRRLIDDPPQGLFAFLEVDRMLCQLGPVYHAFAIHRFVNLAGPATFPNGYEMEKVIQKETNEAFAVAPDDRQYLEARQFVRMKMLERRRRLQAKYKAKYDRKRRKGRG